MEAAAAFLAVRPRSIAETRRRLVHLGYRADLSDQVVARLVESGYLDDEQFARAWVESRDRARPRGTFALRRELVLKGVDRALIDTVLADREGSMVQSGATGLPTVDRAAAERLLERRRAALEREREPRKRWQKAYALLARAGFDPDTCRDTISTTPWLRAENAKD